MIRVIVADDNVPIRSVVQMLIKRSYPGWDITEVENGLEAVKAAEHEPPDLVILDVSMPVMDGFLAAQNIKARRPDIPVIIISGSIDVGCPDEAFRCGAQGYVSKLKLAEQLIPAIQTVLSGAPYPA